MSYLRQVVSPLGVELVVMPPDFGEQADKRCGGGSQAFPPIVKVAMIRCLSNFFAKKYLTKCKLCGNRVKRPRKTYCSAECAHRADRRSWRKSITHRVAKRFRGRIKNLCGIPPEGIAFLMGCTPSELRKHLEAQFLPGMAWSNHGGMATCEGRWDIDHIRPCSSFDLTDPAQRRECFHYTNLRPLWAVENRKRHGIRKRVTAAKAA